MHESEPLALPSHHYGSIEPRSNGLTGRTSSETSTLPNHRHVCILSWITFAAIICLTTAIACYQPSYYSAAYVLLCSWALARPMYVKTLKLGPTADAPRLATVPFPALWTSAAVCLLSLTCLVTQMIYQSKHHGGSMHDFCDIHPAVCDDLLLERLTFAKWRDLAYYTMPQLLMLMGHGLALRFSMKMSRTKTSQVAPRGSSSMRLLIIFCCLVVSVARPTVPDTPLLFLAVYHITFWAWQVESSERSFRIWCTFGSFWSGLLLAMNCMMNSSSGQQALRRSERHYLLHALGVETLRLCPFDWMHAAYLVALACLFLLFSIYKSFFVRSTVGLYGDFGERQMSITLSTVSLSQSPTLLWCYQQSPQLLIVIFAAAALVDPCLLSSVWLAMFCLAILLPLRIYVHLLPWLLAYAWVCLGIFFAAAVRFMPYVDAGGAHHDIDNKRSFLHLLGFKRWDPPFPLLLMQASVGLVIATFNRMLSSLTYDIPSPPRVIDSPPGSPRPPVTLGFGIINGQPPAEESANWSWFTRAKVQVQNFLLYHAAKVTLALLFLVGFRNLNLISAVFMIFFVFYFVNSEIARKTWILLVLYTFGIIMALYIFMLLPDKLTPLMKFVGLSGLNNSPWELVPYMFLYLCAGIQYSLYTIVVPKPQPTENSLKLKHNVLRGLCLFCYLLIALLSPISIISLAFFLVFLLVTAMIILNMRPSVARWMWLIIVVFTSAVVITVYIFQFQAADHLFCIFLDQFHLTAETLGLYRYSNLQLAMLPWMAALVLAVLTAGVSKEVHALKERRSARATNESGVSLSAVTAVNVTWGLKAWAIIRRFLVIHTPKVLLFVLFMAAITPYSHYDQLVTVENSDTDTSHLELHATVSSTVYVVLLLIFNASKDPSSVLVFFTLCYSIGVMMCVYLYQFSLFADILRHVDAEILAYIGLAKAISPQALASFLLPHIAVFTVGLLQTKTLIWRGKMRARGEPMLISLKEVVGPAEAPDQAAGTISYTAAVASNAILSALSWLLDSAFQTWGSDIVLLTALLCATQGLPTIWSLLEVLLVGAAAHWQSLLHGHRLSVVLFLVSCYLSLEFMLYLGLPDFANFPTLPFRPNSESARQFWGVYHDYLLIEPSSSDLWRAFILTAVVGMHSRSQRLFGGTWQPPRRFSDFLVQQKERISEARRTRQVAALYDVVPVPEDASDYTQPPRSATDWIQYLRFFVVPFLLKVWLFWAAANPTDDVFTIFTVAVLICALWTFHIADDITWQGNGIWKVVPRLLWGIMLVKIFMYAPPIFQLLQKTSISELTWVGFQDFHTPINFVIMLAAVYLQTHSFDDPHYAFVLHYIHRQHCRAHDIVLANRQLCAQREDEYYAQLQKESEDRKARVKMIAEDRKAKEEGKISQVQVFSRIKPITSPRQPLPSQTSSNGSLPPSPHLGQAAASAAAFSSTFRQPSNTYESWSQRARNAITNYYQERCIPLMEMMIERLQQMSVVTSHEEIPSRKGEGKVVTLLLGSVIQFLLSYTDWMCYIMLVVKFTVHPSVLTLLPPLSIFTYALLIEAPSHFYWSFMLFWFQMLIVVGSLMTMLNPSNAILLFCERFNIYRTVEQDPTYSLLFDLATLLCINVHRSEMLKFRISTEDSPEMAPLLRTGTPRGGSSSAFFVQGQSRAARIFISLRNWVDDLRNRRKVGRDLYFRSFIAAMLGFVVLLFSFDSIAGASQDFVSSVQNNLLPGSLVLTLFGYFLSMVLDRVCYLVRSPVLKMLWHYSVVILVFTVAYKYLLVRSQDQWQLQLLLWITFTWLSFSALQLYWGYPQTLGSSWLMAGYHPYRHLMYIAYRAIPFVYEMKALLDWSCTPTTLKMNEWLKLEDIHHELVLARADREDTKLKARKRGTPFTFRQKCSTGCSIFTLLSLLIFFPLMYYSSFSPALAPNSINMTKVSLQFPTTSDIFEGRYRALTYDLPTTAQSDTMATALAATRPGLSDVLQDKYVQVITFSEYSLSVWDASPPSLQHLLGHLPADLLGFEMQAQFTRARGLGGPDFSVTQNYTLDLPQRQKLYEILALGNRSELMLPAFYCPFIVNNPLSISMIDSSASTGKWLQDCKLVYNKIKVSNLTYWQLYCRSLFRGGNSPTGVAGPERTCVDSGGFRCSNLDYSAAAANRDHKWVPLYFVVMSSEVPKQNGLGGFFQSFSIMAIYSTFVLTAGRVIRLMLTGSAQRVVLEDMKNPEPLISLVEDIKLARAEGELALEEDLYEELINIYRSPELIQQWTAPS